MHRLPLTSDRWSGNSASYHAIGLILSFSKQPWHLGFRIHDPTEGIGPYVSLRYLLCLCYPFYGVIGISRLTCWIMDSGIIRALFAKKHGRFS